MVVAGLFFIAALILCILFWVWVVRGILAKVYKTAFGKGNVIALILFGVFSWGCFFIGGGVLAAWFLRGGVQTIATNGVAFAAVTKESVQRGWSAGLLEKISALDCTLDRIEEVEDELNFLDDAYKTFEATLVVENHASAAPITYKEVQKANAVYAEDENGVFVPAFLVNHAALDEVPWFWRYFMPAYRREQRQEYIPVGKSYLNIRIDIASGHTVQKIGIGNTVLTVAPDKIQPLKKDGGVRRALETATEPFKDSAL
ncbi:MAG: hypothetical protein IJ191_07280 [Treponema sp.]|nr:hypothetical protein [Treponema sp.]